MSERSASRRYGRLDDERLAALVRSGDQGAFEMLYERHHASLLASCRRMLGNREDGEDALQEAFVRAHRALRAGRPPDAVRPWLFAIARNRCRTMLAARRESAWRSTSSSPASMASPTTSGGVLSCASSWPTSGGCPTTSARRWCSSSSAI